MPTRVLAADVGGTKVLLQIAERAGDEYRVLAEQRYESAAYDGLLPMVREFQRATGYDRAGEIEAACIGVAGPVVRVGAGATAKVTNLPWRLESDTLARELGVAKIRLINDFQAQGYGIEALGPDDFVVLQAGAEEPHGPRVVLGAGTGLGQGLLIWTGVHYEAVPTEGGHVDFAPIDDLQLELLQFLRRRFGRVSYERVLSGPGLVNVYEFFRQRPDGGRGPDLREAPDPAAAISDAARRDADPDAVRTVALFVRVYGAQAGNVALGCLATGGVYIGGGIAPKMLAALADGAFIQAFIDKGRMAQLLAAMPVRLVTNPRVGLLGAVRAATRL